MSWPLIRIIKIVKRAYTCITKSWLYYDWIYNKGIDKYYWDLRQTGTKISTLSKTQGSCWERKIGLNILSGLCREKNGLSKAFFERGGIIILNFQRILWITFINLKTVPNGIIGKGNNYKSSSREGNPEYTNNHRSNLERFTPKDTAPVHKLGVFGEECMYGIPVQG